MKKAPASLSSAAKLLTKDEARRIAALAPPKVVVERSFAAGEALIWLEAEVRRDQPAQTHMKNRQCFRRPVARRYLDRCSLSDLLRTSNRKLDTD
jgi:hypothetical protein